MLTVSKGAAIYRTKLMDQAQASRFAHCLKANGRFEAVEVLESSRSAGRFLVTFSPVNDERKAQMIGTLAEQREARAEAEGADYIWCAEDTGRFQWCFNPKSGETYEVTRHSCTCGDYTWRCKGLGIACKHMICLAHRRGTFAQWE